MPVANSSKLTDFEHSQTMRKDKRTFFTITSVDSTKLRTSAKRYSAIITSHPYLPKFVRKRTADNGNKYLMSCHVYLDVCSLQYNMTPPPHWQWKRNDWGAKSNVTSKQINITCELWMSFRVTLAGIVSNSCYCRNVRAESPIMIHVGIQTRGTFFFWGGGRDSDISQCCRMLDFADVQERKWVRWR